MNGEYPETNSYEIPEIYLDNNKDPNNIPLGNEMSEIEKEKKLNETEKSNIQNDPIKNQIKQELPIFFAICKQCKHNFAIKFINKDFRNAECKCKYIRKIDHDHFITDYCSKEQLYIRCERHNKKYVKYCIVCKLDLCEECLKEKASAHNKDGKIKAHETHSFITFSEEINELKDKLEKIKKMKEDEINKKSIKNEENTLQENNEICYYIEKLINKLIESFNKYPSYYLYKSILSAIICLKKYLNEELIESLGDNPKQDDLIKINSLKELKEKIDSSKSIYKIIIDGSKEKEGMESLELFKNKNFDNLKRLQMNNIKNLKDISALLNSSNSCSFPKLEKMIFGSANINNDCINVIKKMKLPMIKFISLYDNKITSPEIFGAIKNFNSLEKFYIGNNKLVIDEKAIKNIKFPDNLIELGMNFCFKKDTNYFIFKHLNLKNIKLLYVGGNGITSLKMFEGLHN